VRQRKDWLEALEFPEVLDLLATLCETEEGKTFAQRVRPMSALSAIKERLSHLVELLSLAHAAAIPSLAGFHPPSGILKACAVGAQVGASSFRSLHDSLKTGEKAVKFFHGKGDEVPGVLQFCRSIPRVAELCDILDAVVDNRDQIRDTASPEISRIRRHIEDLDGQISGKLRRITRGHEFRRMLQFPEPTFSGERYVLAVKSEFRSRVSGIYHYSSDSGATAYIEPEAIVEPTNDLIREKAAERAEERRLLSVLAGAVSRRSVDLEQFFAAIAYLDFLLACTRFATTYECTAPWVGGSQALSLKDARHPLLVDRYLRECRQGNEPEPVVPMSLTLGSDFSVLVVTGPNTGGKTVSLKTIGLISLMALSGLPVPAAEAYVPLLDAVYADIGDEQSIEQNLSTFSSHIGRIVEILKTVTPASLVLLDELGSGTDPAEGAALGRAIIEELVARGSLSAITTHIGSLKQLAFADKRIQNASMEFSLANLRPTYHLTVGEAGESKALQVASRLGMPERIIQRSREFVETSAAQERQLWDEMQQLRRELESDSATTRKLRREAEDLHQEAEEFKEEWRKMAEAVSIRESNRKPVFKVGDPVYVRALRANGVVEKVNSRKGIAAVSVHGKSLSIPVADLEPPR